MRERWKVLWQKAFYSHHIIIAKVDVVVEFFTPSVIFHKQEKNREKKL